MIREASEVDGTKPGQNRDGNCVMAAEPTCSSPLCHQHLIFCCFLINLIMSRDSFGRTFIGKDAGKRRGLTSAEKLHCEIFQVTKT